MNLPSLVQSIYAKPPTAAQLEEAANSMSISLETLLDAFAREVAEGYMSGKYSWEVGDCAMTNLFATAYGPADICLSQFAYDVYIAFDEGEYMHKDQSELDGEPRTQALLRPLLESHGV